MVSRSIAGSSTEPLPTSPGHMELWSFGKLLAAAILPPRENVSHCLEPLWQRIGLLSRTVILVYEHELRSFQLPARPLAPHARPDLSAGENPHPDRPHQARRCHRREGNR